MKKGVYRLILAQVLIVDTDIDLYDYSVHLWAEYGIKSYRVDNIEQALECMSINNFNLVVIVEFKEQRQKVLNSIKIIRELTTAPIVIASNDPIDPEYSITAYNMGVIEVWGMPKKIEEAAAKGNSIIQHFIAQNRKIDTQSTIVVNKQIIISISQRLVFVKGNEIDLTKIEFDILGLLITHPGRVFEYEQIFRQIWGEEYTSNAKEVLRNHICKLRDKIQIDSSLPNFIKTNQGIGYSFISKHDIL